MVFFDYQKAPYRLLDVDLQPGFYMPGNKNPTNENLINEVRFILAVIHDRKFDAAFYELALYSARYH